MTPPTNGSADPQPRLAERLLVRGGMVVTGALLVSALGAWTDHVRPPAPAAPTATVAPLAAFNGPLKTARNEMVAAKVQLARAQAVLRYSSHYRIAGDLSAAIYDVAVSEGIRPEIAYELVKAESNFKRTARSSASALGLTQIQLRTARQYDRHVTESQLLERDVNLRLGFRYLKDLIGQFDNDAHLALLAYNRGPGRVEQILAEGGNPRNGYSSSILKGYKATAPSRGASN